jgi:hypothetical protein
MGEPVGSKYENVLNGDKKLSFGDALTRANREAVMQNKGNKKRPPVGHYRPKHVQVFTRSEAHKFSEMPRKM